MLVQEINSCGCKTDPGFLLPVSQGPLSAHRGNVEFLVMGLSPVDPLTACQLTCLKPVRENVSRVSLLARQSLSYTMYVTRVNDIPSLLLYMLVRGKSLLHSGEGHYIRV